LAERLAWAQKHGVRPPEFALAEARRSGLTFPCNPSLAGTCNACCKRSDRVASVHKVRPCCTQRDDLPSNDHSPGHVVAWQALKCKGHSLNWLAAVPILIRVQPQFAHRFPLIALLGPVASDNIEHLSEEPAVPPPKRA
jgi:hypothetical protein